MRYFHNKDREKKKIAEAKREAEDRLLEFSAMPQADLLAFFEADAQKGLTAEAAEAKLEEHGPNVISYKNENTLFRRIWGTFVNPFSTVLFALAAVSFVLDFILANPGEKDPAASIIIVALLLVSGGLRYFQEEKSNRAGEKLKDMIKTTAAVLRDGAYFETHIEELTPGDVIKLAAGDMVPADVRVLTNKDLFVRQSSMTGEAEPVEKFSVNSLPDAKNPLEHTHLAFMGTNVLSGSATAVILSTGNATLLGSMAKSITEKRGQTNFDKGINSVSWLLIRFMAIMVPIVFVATGLTKGDWLNALLFAMSIAVGLTPEMLPMIVAGNLAKGAVFMSKKKVIIKNLNAIQSIGAMDTLCTDKTGTLTEDRIVLERHLDVYGNENMKVLKYAYLNSYFQTGLKNLLDIAVIDSGKQAGLDTQYNVLYEKVDEIPFDFVRRRMSVVIADWKERGGRTQIVTKGAIEEMLAICTRCEYEGAVIELTGEIKQKIFEVADRLNNEGMRVLAVARKEVQLAAGAFSIKDESEMVLTGYIGFLDPPKASCAQAMKALAGSGVNVKILTGDNEKVTNFVCGKVGIKVSGILLGSDVEEMDDGALSAAVENNNVFAKLAPAQKARVIAALQGNGHVVGYMGDGINDAPAMRKADIAISVDTAVDIAKEAADAILLEKDLMVLEAGILEGRRTFGNIIKYIKMTASSNFGNMFSVLAASIFLPFLPMMAIHILILNMIYDVSCITIPWDNVDADYLKVPRKWDASKIGRFMIWIGPTSSLFDITTYLLMFFWICPVMSGGQGFFGILLPSDILKDGNVIAAAGMTVADALKQSHVNIDVLIKNIPDVAKFVSVFQTGWFVESLITQTLVVHMIRTQKVPFIQSRAARPVLISTVLAAAAGIAIPFTFLGQIFGMAALSWEFFGILAATVVGYVLLVTLIKKLYVKRYGELL
ncbi:MAG: magnesium-translocating P-type ATPase [Clostridiales bacterium]|nr:magnesium-translocating P-type ATPase [Clostridiales bacterium]